MRNQALPGIKKLIDGKSPIKHKTEKEHPHPHVYKPPPPTPIPPRKP